MHALIRSELQGRLRQFRVRIDPEIFSEASVSAVVRFTWRHPKTGNQEAGVFKVLKAHVPGYFSEDMALLHGLTEFLTVKHRDSGFAERVLPETFNEVRRLLEHEIDFPREQATLLEARQLYRNTRGVRVPTLIPQLSTANLTALSEEAGVKVTDAAQGMNSAERRRLAEQLIESLIAAPLFARPGKAMFHADPHAGNLLYEVRSRELTLLDWALTERLSAEQQRQLALLVLKLGLRDVVGCCRHIAALSVGAVHAGRSNQLTDSVRRFIGSVPLVRIPGILDAMKLLEQVAMQGMRFPAPLIMLRKAMFTLDGILHQITGTDFNLDLVLARYWLREWRSHVERIGSPLALRDWIELQSSAWFYGGRWWTHLAQALLPHPAGLRDAASYIWPVFIFDRLLLTMPQAASACETGQSARPAS